jgi:NADH-quinone oxidoreductase subunit K
MMFETILFFAFSAVLVGAALGVVLARNPVYSALLLVLCFFNSAVIWLMLDAEFLGIVLVLVYVGAVMVLFLFVVMMLDVNLEELRKGLAGYWPIAAAVAGLMAFAILNETARRARAACRAAVAAGLLEHAGAWRGAVHALRGPGAARRGDPAGREHRGDRADPAASHRREAAERRRAGEGVRQGSGTAREDAFGETPVITLTEVLTLSGLLFSIAVAGVVLNRKNVILLLMCIELMLLAVNFNFVAFSRFLGDINGQIFVFFILTVAAAEAAIGLAILVVLFRERRSIDVEDLDSLQG